MKKWMIPVLLLFFGGLLLLYYYLGKKPVVPQAEPVAKPVAEPAAFKDFSMSACLKMPPEKILASHKTVQGYSFRGMEYGRFKKVYQLIAGYYTCLAAGSRRLELCNKLPADSIYAAEWKTVTLSPRTMCANEYRMLAFSTYMTGKSRNAADCKEFLASDHIKGAKFPPEEFCSIASRGIENICTSLASRGKLPVEIGECRQVFPRNLEDCMNSPNCQQMWQIHKLISSGGTEGGAGYYQPMAAAYLQKSSLSCQEIADELIGTYCKFQNEAIRKKR